MAEAQDTITIRVNGQEHRLTGDGSRTLLNVLRNDLGLTGTKHGCGQGQCGACTVLLDDEPVRACTLPVAAVAGRSVTTIEGLAQPDGTLHPVQQAFLEVQAFQCGYCTPGQILGAVGLLRRNPNPSEEQIREAMAAHLCRCATYARILRAVQLAAEMMAG
jgi:aerobic-type carbon monoxide dehydrogenase small subunit (CoxS/CutS family)